MLEILTPVPCNTTLAKTWNRDQERGVQKF